MAIQANEPYPPVAAQGRNPIYAEMILGNIGGAVSEMSAVAQYRYNRLMAEDENQALAGLFQQISIVEMHHLDDFSKLAKLLGADPRMWQSCGCQKKYWSAGLADYEFCSLRDMVRKAIAEEKAAIRKYSAQANCISDPYVEALLRRVTLDEQEHVKALEQALAGL